MRGRTFFSNTAIKEIVESRGAAFKLRQKRSSQCFPNSWDDIAGIGEAGTCTEEPRCKNADGINRGRYQVV